MPAYKGQPLSAELKKQWVNERNHPLNPDQILDNSTKEAWWRCYKGHEWKAKVRNRKLYGCPYCANQKVLAGYNDLLSQHPEIASQWNEGKNSISPDRILSQSSKKAWWQCDRGHVWEAKVFKRTREGQGCPYCANQKKDASNQISSRFPHLNESWNLTRNKVNLDDRDISSSTRYWWVCPEGHEWEATIKARTYQKTNCPYCSGRYVIPGVTDLVTKAPHLIPEWSTKNTTSPKEVNAGSKKKYIWECKLNHEWEATADSRVKGGSCPYCSNKNVLVGYNDLATTRPNVATQWHPTKNGKHSPTDFTYGSEHRAWWQCDKGHEWSAYIYSRNRAACPYCSTGQNSKAEQELTSYLSDIGVPQIIRNTRQVIPPKELDIYLPDYQTAIEYNGLYWHTESSGKEDTYHQDKWLACQSKGIQLIQIWEDDWTNRPEVVKRMLAHKLGLAKTRRIFARKTTVHTIPQKEANKFLQDNHIQGAATGSLRYGLFCNETLVGVMVLKKEANTEQVVNLLRFATSETVVGGFTKLLQHMLTENPNVQKVITFSDNSISDGGLYQSNGFHHAADIPPDYMYLIGGVRHHKFNYRLKRFREDPTLLYKPELSERELANLNGLDRIWDAGKVRWEYTRKLPTR
jgi:hypothetical protein